MEKENNMERPLGKSENENSNHKEGKFNLVSCPVTESYCNKILAEINKLYAESELARINKEYLRSVSLLEEAYELTNLLKNKSCLLCASFFQHTINKTFDIMKEELYDISHGMFSSKSYKLAYKKLCNR
ncbi:MAG: hypothetical protein JXR61_11805 [Prolixibacteraceae bacterium]|nr:hypothetical protein [Prolixibacteraceae bacterium]